MFGCVGVCIILSLAAVVMHIVCLCWWCVFVFWLLFRSYFDCVGVFGCVGVCIILSLAAVCMYFVCLCWWCVFVF